MDKSQIQDIKKPEASERRLPVFHQTTT